MGAEHEAVSNCEHEADSTRMREGVVVVASWEPLLLVYDRDNVFLSLR